MPPGRIELPLPCGNWILNLERVKFYHFISMDYDLIRKGVYENVYCCSGNYRDFGHQKTQANIWDTLSFPVRASSTGSISDSSSSIPRTTKDFPLIYSQQGYKHFSNTTLCMLFSKIYDDAGMRNSSHAGRRTFATKLNAKGVGMRTIQMLMGHKHIGTTALYCDVSDETLRNAVGLV